MNINPIPGRRLIIAVDGFSSCGKSTFARAIARRLGFIYVDTGAMYRGATLFALELGLIVDGKPNVPALVRHMAGWLIEFRTDPATGQNALWMNGRCVEHEIRGLEVSGAVSEVSAIKEVRAHMVRLQQEMGRCGGLVMDGRDIGTTVFPQAEIKIFMTADVDVRAQRRYLELQQKGIPASLSDIRKNIEQRDYIDQNRAESPLRQAQDALVLDNSHMTPEQQMVWLEDMMQQKGFMFPEREGHDY